MNRLARMSISTRLFIAVLAVAAAAVVAAGFASHRSFSHGFLGYLNKLAIERIDSALPRLEAAYAEHGSWEFLREQPRNWIRLMIRNADDDLHAEHEAPPISDLTGAFLRVTLLDAERLFVIGYPGQIDDDRIERPIRVNGQIVGWLSLARFQSVTEVGAQRFERAQQRATWLIVAAAILLAAAIAWWVARAVLLPIRRVARATHELAGGNYARRVPEIGEDEVGQLSRDFNHLALTLERNETLRREFMADIAHELRTPLGILHGELEAIEDGIRPFSREALHSLQSEVGQLNKLVTDLNDLALTDVAALAYRKENIDLAACVAEVTERCAPRLAQHALQLQCALPTQPVMVFADPARLRQLLHNLLENSCRYTDSGGQLQWRLDTTGHPAEAILRCEDSAPGVAVELLPRLFDRFYRVEGSRNRASGGAGLGLAICRNIVQAHDGQIEATASSLGGLAITIRLPLARSGA
ncbi:two-component sensor histidine kinase [Uliginosibacterium sp. TH139]|nr:two-component sensor histidine kinase [Uliginosibacterium sp. TH139]